MRAGGTMVGVVEVFAPAPAGTPQSIGDAPSAVVATRTNGATDTLLRIPPMPKQSDALVIPELTQRQFIRRSADGEFWCAIGRVAAPGLSIACIDAAGKPALQALRTEPTRRTTEAIWNGAVATMAKGGTKREDVTGFFHRPPVLPAGFDLLVNRNGEVWILASHPAEPTLTWTRLRADGSAFAPLTVAGRVTLRALDGKWYYAADTDADDLQTLIRCQIPER